MSKTKAKEPIYIGVGAYRADQNVYSLTIHHFFQNYGNKQLLFCSGRGKIETAGRGEDWLEKIKSGETIPFKAATDVLCKKCEESVLKPGTDEEKYRERIKRYRERQTKKVKKENLNHKIERLIASIRKEFFSSCFTCKFPLITRNFSFGDLDLCENCMTQWKIEISCQPTGLFEASIRKNKERKIYNRALGQILWSKPFIHYQK